MKILKMLVAACIAAVLPAVALAQSSPNLTKGQVLTAGQWNALFASKQDVLNGPCAGCAGLGSNTFTGTQTIIPAAGTLSRGINVNQTSPLGGSFAGPVLFNVFNTVDQGITITGSGPDDFGMGKQNGIGLRAQYTTTSNGLRGAFAGSITATGSGSYYGVVGSAYSKGTVGGLWAGIGLIVLDSPAAAQIVVGLEGEMALRTGSSALYSVAVGANTQGTVGGSVLHAAFAVSAGPDLLSAPFTTMLAISSNIYGGQAPLATTANILSADTSITIANVLKGDNITVTGNILSFPNMAVGGNGSAIFGGIAANLPGAGNAIFTRPSGGSILLSPGLNGTAGSTGIQTTASSTTNGMFAGAFEAANTSTRFGQTAGNWSEVISFGSTNLGMMLGTITSQPLILGTANTARITISNAGVITLSAPLGVGSGGTGLASGTSGGLLYFSAAGTISSSPVLTGYQLLMGQGPNQPPIGIGSLGTNTQVLHGNAVGAPFFGAVANADLVNSSITINGVSIALGASGTITASATSIAAGTTTVTGGPGVLSNASSGGTLVSSLTLPSSLTAASFTVTTAFTATGLVTNAALAPMTTNTVKGNATSGSASPTDLTMTSCSTGGSALTWTTNTGFACNTSITAAAVPASGITGATLAAGVTASSLTSLGTIASLTATAIGSVTPGTGAFTTLTASTSITSPIAKSTGSLTFQSNGSTFAGAITTGQQWFLGANASPAAGALLTLNQNTGSPSAGTFGTLNLHVVGADAASPSVTADSYGGQSFIESRYAGDTQASKSAPTVGTLTFSLLGRAWDTAAYGAMGAVDFITGANTWTASDHGGGINFRTVADASTSLLSRVRFQPNGGVNIGATQALLSAGELGMNKIAASGTAPGAGTAKLAIATGTTGTTCKLIMYAGTSTTPTTIIDNVGTGC